MAIGVSEFSTELASSLNVTSYAMAAGGPGNNSILLVFVAATGTVATGTMTGGSLSWTKITSQLYNTVDTIYAFWANTGPSAPGSVAPTFDCTGDAATGVVMMAFEITGADTTTPVRQFKARAATGANPTFTFDVAPLATSAQTAAFGIPRNPPVSAPPGGGSWNEQADAGYATPTAGASFAYNVGDTASTITFTSASGAYGIIGVEIAVAPVAGAILDPMGMMGIFGL